MAVGQELAAHVIGLHGASINCAFLLYKKLLQSMMQVPFIEPYMFRFHAASTRTLH